MALPLMNTAATASIMGSESLKTRSLLHGNKGLAAVSSSLKRSAPFLPPLSGRRNQTFVVSAEAQTQTVEKQQTETHTRLGRRSFPADFVFGAATSAYQTSSPTAARPPMRLRKKRIQLTYNVPDLKESFI